MAQTTATVFSIFFQLLDECFYEVFWHVRWMEILCAKHYCFTAMQNENRKAQFATCKFLVLQILVLLWSVWTCVLKITFSLQYRKKKKTTQFATCMKTEKYLLKTDNLPLRQSANRWITFHVNRNWFLVVVIAVLTKFKMCWTVDVSFNSCTILVLK